MGHFLLAGFLASLLMLAITSTAGGFGFITRWAGLSGGMGFASVTTDTHGDVYAIDGGADNLIEKFTSSGVLLTHWGGSGMGSGTFNGALSIATDGAGSVYVADTGDDLIQKFTSSGVFVTQWGGARRGHGKLDQPIGVTTDRTGNVYVSDFKHDRIQKFTGSGHFLAQWSGRFLNPEGVATDARGNVYVVDGSNLIFKYGRTGPGSPSKCVVPNLRGESLTAARKSLTKSGCRLGTVTPKGRTTGKVKNQNPKAGKVLPSARRVNVELG